MRNNNSAVIIASVAGGVAVLYLLLKKQSGSTLGGASAVDGSGFIPSLIPTVQSSGVNLGTQTAQQKRIAIVDAALNKGQGLQLTDDYKALGFLGVLELYGVDQNNKSQKARQYVGAVYPGADSTDDVADLADNFFPDVRAARGVDGKFAALNPKLQAAGINMQLKRVHPAGIAGIIQSAGSLFQVGSAIAGLV